MQSDSVMLCILYHMRKCRNLSQIIIAMRSRASGRSKFCTLATGMRRIIEICREGGQARSINEAGVGG
jgi:hypothetical protein